MATTQTPSRCTHPPSPATEAAIRPTSASVPVPAGARAASTARGGT